MNHFPDTPTHCPDHRKNNQQAGPEGLKGFVIDLPHDALAGEVFVITIRPLIARMVGPFDSMLD